MEDDSLLDDDIIVKETPPQSVTPGTFSKNLINRLGLHSQQPQSETASLDNNDTMQGRRMWSGKPAWKASSTTIS